MAPLGNNKLLLNVSPVESSSLISTSSDSIISSTTITTSSYTTYSSTSSTSTPLMDDEVLQELVISAAADIDFQAKLNCSGYTLDDLKTKLLEILIGAGGGGGSSINGVAESSILNVT